MNTNEILSHIDSLLKESRLNEAEKYMKATLSDAEKSDRPDIMLTLTMSLQAFTVTAAGLPKHLKAAAARRSFLKK